MNKISNQFSSIQQVTDQYLNTSKVSTPKEVTDATSFQKILQSKQLEQEANIGELKFSKHAAKRLEDRNINLSKTQLERLGTGTQKASEKGIKDSLVLMDSLAFIVNVPSNTVVTALDQAESNGNIFTNIDGAVII